MSSIKTKGTKKEVYYGKALKTSGGLTKDDLILNARGKVVSKKQSANGKKRFEENKQYMKPFSKKDEEPPPAKKSKKSKKR